ncbi:MAG: polyprenyl synthetase family protein [bacterium]
MSEFKFPDFYVDQKKRVETALEKYLPPEDSKPAVLSRAMRYSVLNGGKRLRGVLVLEAARLGGSENSGAAELLAAVVEMIHAYSLVHDDLPAMDDDDYRRGQPTCHRKFGEDIAILAGDALLTRGFELLGFLEDFEMEHQTVVRIIRDMGKTAGSRGLIGGQVEDLTVDPRQAGIEELESIHNKKTGALITNCLIVGGLAGGGSEKLLAALTDFGKKIGLAFQIKDDLLDLSSNFEVLGKDVNSDIESDKLTYPRLLGGEEAKRLLEKLVADAEQELLQASDQADRLVALARLIVARDH